MTSSELIVPLAMMITDRMIKELQKEKCMLISQQNPSNVLSLSVKNARRSQGSVDGTKDMLVAWLSERNSKDWTTGIKFQKNSAHNSWYSAMFRSEARIGLASSSLQNELMPIIDSEADLFAVLEDNAEAEDVTMHSSCDTDTIDSRTVQMNLLLLKTNRPREW